MLTKFPQLLSEALDNSYLDISEVADSLNISRQTVSDWIDGKKRPSLPHFAALCKEFSISADFLLGFSQKISRQKDDSFLLPYEISERLKRLTTEGIELVYQIIRYISVAGDSLLLFDSFYHDLIIHPDAQMQKEIRLSQASTNSLLNELDPDLRAKAEGYLEGIREAQHARNSNAAQEA